MSYNMEYDVREYFILCRLNGRIGGEASIKLFKDIKGVIDDYAEKAIILDFGGVDFIDSSGLGSLVAVNSTLLKQNRELILTAVPNNLMGLLKITNLHHVLKIVGSVNDVQYS